MRGKLRIEARAGCQQTLSTGNIVKVGHRLACEHRIVIQAALLRSFDFRIPISAFHQPHHHAAVMVRGEAVDPVDDFNRALLIGLDGEAKAVPPFERRISKHRSNHIEREFEAVGLFCVHREIHVVLFGLLRQIEQHRHKFLHYTLARYPLITWMKGGQLYRNTGARGQGLIAGRLANRRDR